MNVKLVYNVGLLNNDLTLNKVYKVIKECPGCYYLNDDNGDCVCLRKHRFEVTR